MPDWRAFPVYINCRDRVYQLRELIAWLENAGHRRIILLDNGSTYGPLLEYLAATPHEVVRLGQNYGSRSLWRTGRCPDEFFVYTDPDVIPVYDCPPEAVGRLYDVLAPYPRIHKAGLGLYTKDLPPNMPSLEWETGPVINGSVVEPGVRRSLVDTTFALYRPGTPFMFEAVRTEWPYQCRHMPWYPAADDEEERERAYYLAHAQGGPEFSSWKSVA